MVKSPDSWVPATTGVEILPLSFVAIVDMIANYDALAKIVPSVKKSSGRMDWL